MTLLKAMRTRLTTHFFTEHRFISSGSICLLAKLSFRPQIIVGRDHCQYVCIKLSHIPKAKRENALRHQVELIANWVNTDYSVAWQDGVAQVWMWDRDELSLLVDESNGLVKAILQKPQLIAEVAYWEKPKSSGLYLFEAKNGFDLQFWCDGVLDASRWFFQLPSLMQVQRFERSIGLSPSVSLPEETIKPSLRGEPWAGINTNVLNNWVEHSNQIVRFGLFALLLIASFQISSIARWYWVNQEFLSAIKKVETSADKLLSARGEARRTAVEIHEIVSLFEMPDPLSSQLEIYQRLPAGLNLKLLAWERNIDKVEMQIEGRISNTLSLVRAFDHDGITDVRVEPLREPNQYLIRLRIEPPYRRLGEVSK